MSLGVFHVKVPGLNPTQDSNDFLYFMLNEMISGQLHMVIYPNLPNQQYIGLSYCSYQQRQLGLHSGGAWFRGSGWRFSAKGAEERYLFLLLMCA